MSEHVADKGLPPEAAPFAILWARAESKRLHREHPPPCELTTTPTGKCTCTNPAAPVKPRTQQGGSEGDE